MLFNSFVFLVFLPIIYLIYWSLNKKTTLQNIILIVASYVFYGYWDWRFLFLLFFSSISDYIIGLKLSESNNEILKKRLLYLSLTINLGVLGFFKYYNFFIDSFIDLFLQFGVEVSPRTLSIILPVGISFYTFQTLSYTIDIFKGNLKATKKPIEFIAFVSFFPQLVAGPIERASRLLPQFKVSRIFKLSDLKNGLRQILAGFFKKIVIADNCSIVVDQIFGLPEYDNGIVLIIGIVLFAFQIYGDFSGYSDIGIGVAKLFGFHLNKNFNYPYFSSSVREFWQNWHISLSTWFKDYVYIPLGGNRLSKSRTVVNLLLTFTLSGLWHGANYTFIIWGFINGLYLVAEYQFSKFGVFVRKRTFLNFFKILFTFLLINITWVFFRADSIEMANQYLQGIFYHTFESNLFQVHQILFPKGYLAILLLSILIIMEIMNRERSHFLDIEHLSKFKRVTLYLFTILITIMFGSFYGVNDFIYFQF